MASAVSTAYELSLEAENNVSRLHIRPEQVRGCIDRHGLLDDEGGRQNRCHGRTLWSPALKPVLRTRTAKWRCSEQV